MKHIGRYISCGIVTEIIVLNKGSLKEHKNDILKKIDKDDFKYCIDDFLKLSDEIKSHSENYLYCTDMSNETQFHDSMTNINNFYMFLNHIPLYSNFNKTDSEDITFTLRFLNHFLRKSLKSELKSTLIFGLTD